MPDERGKSRSKMADNTRFMAKMTGRDSARPMYAAVVDGMDQAIGKVLDTLDVRDLLTTPSSSFSRTTVALSTPVGGADNAPLRGGG